MRRTDAVSHPPCQSYQAEARYEFGIISDYAKKSTGLEFAFKYLNPRVPNSGGTFTKKQCSTSSAISDEEIRTVLGQRSHLFTKYKGFLSGQMTLPVDT